MTTLVAALLAASAGVLAAALILVVGGFVRVVNVRLIRVAWCACVLLVAAILESESHTLLAIVALVAALGLALSWRRTFSHRALDAMLAVFLAQILAICAANLFPPYRELAELVAIALLACPLLIAAIAAVARLAARTRSSSIADTGLNV